MNKKLLNQLQERFPQNKNEAKVAINELSLGYSNYSIYVDGEVLTGKWLINEAEIDQLTYITSQPRIEIEEELLEIYVSLINDFLRESK